MTHFLAKWNYVHFKKSTVRSTCLLAWIIRNFTSIWFLSLHRNRETNLKPTEMNINIILNHHCVQFLNTFIRSLKPGLVEKKESSKLFLYPQLSGHLPAQLLSLAYVRPSVCLCEHTVCWSSNRVVTCNFYKLLAWIKYDKSYYNLLLVSQIHNIA